MIDEQIIKLATQKGYKSTLAQLKETGDIIELTLLQKWIRDEYKLILLVTYNYEFDSTPYTFLLYRENSSTPLNTWKYDFSTYEEALSIGLQETLNLI